MTGARASSAALAATLESLRAVFGERLVESLAVRVQHANALSEVPNQPPDAVVFPRTTAEVADAVRACAAHGVPVIPFGAGTSFEGHINAPYGGISIDTSQMKRIIEVNRDDLDCRVEAGVTREELDQDLRDTGLFFPIDPGASFFPRGNGRDPRLRHQRGALRDDEGGGALGDGRACQWRDRAHRRAGAQVVGRLRPDPADGRLGRNARRHHRDSASGSPASRKKSAAACARFPRSGPPANSVILTTPDGIPIARIELLDELQVKACNAYSRLGLPETPMLFRRVPRLPSVGRRTGRALRRDRPGFGGGPLKSASLAEERHALWAARRDAYWAARGLRPTAKGISTDVCVPISSLSACVEETKADAVASGILAPIVGHVGDGNFHVMPLIDFGNPAEVEAGAAFVDRLVRRALAFGGTTTGEHGIGQSNIEISRHRVQRRHARHDAHHQAGARPPEHHEPGQGDSGFLEARALP